MENLKGLRFVIEHNCVEHNDGILITAEEMAAIRKEHQAEIKCIRAEYALTPY